MRSAKFVVEIMTEDHWSPTDWQLQTAVSAALKTLNHARHNLGNVTVVDVIPVQGSLDHAVNLVTALRCEAEESVRAQADFQSRSGGG